MKNNMKISVAVLIMLTVGIVGTAQENNKWGGIPSSVDNPPPGTTIDKNLSSYYHTPVATGEGKAYWFIGGWGWFNQSEVRNLPSMSLMYNISPYDCEASGNCGSSGVHVPISIAVILLFVVSAVYMVRRRK